MTKSERGGGSEEASSMRRRIDARFDRLGRSIARRPWRIIVGVLVAIFALSTEARHVTLDTNPEAFLDADHDARVRYDAFKREYGQDDSVLIAIRSDAIWTPEFLVWLRELHEALEEQVPFANEVTSLVNARVTRGEGDALVVDDLLEPWPESREAIERVEAIANANPLYQNLLLRRDANLTAVFVELATYADEAESVFEGFEGADGEADGRESPRFLTGVESSLVSQAVAAVVAEKVAAYDGDPLEVHVVGMPRLVEMVNIRTKTNLIEFTGYCFVAIMVVLGLIFRRLPGVYLPLLVSGLAVAATFGVAGLRGLPLNVTAQMIPSLLLAVGVSSTIHLLVVFFQEVDRGVDRADAVASCLRHSALPIVLASLTTMGGLLSFNAADLTMLRDVGVLAPVGLLFQLILVLTFLPALLSVVPVRPRDASSRAHEPGLAERIMVGVGDLAVSRPWPVVIAFACIAVVVGSGARHIWYEFDPQSFLPWDDPLRASMDVVNEELGNTSSVELLIDTGVENGLYEPDFLARLDTLHRESAHLRGGEFGDISVGKTLSVLDIVKEIHQALNENRSDFYRAPDDRALIAQELLLFESSGSEDLEEFVDARMRRARFTLRVPYVSPSDFGDFLPDTEALARRVLGPDVDVEITGMLPLMTVVQQEIRLGLIKSYTLALIIITPLMMLLIGSIVGGMVAMVPNLVPILLVVGMMGWVGLEMSVVTMMVGSIALGLAVDDTIHFVHQFYRYRALTGDVRLAVRETMRTTGLALLTTSIVLSMGFVIFMLSDLRNLQSFGFVTTSAIVFAFVADVMLAPALLSLLSSGRPDAAEIGGPGDVEPDGPPPAFESSAAP